MVCCQCNAKKFHTRQTLSSCFLRLQKNTKREGSLNIHKNNQNEKFIFISPLVLITIIYFSIIKTLPKVMTIVRNSRRCIMRQKQPYDIHPQRPHRTLSLYVTSHFPPFDYIRDKNGTILFLSAFAFSILSGGVMESAQKHSSSTKCRTKRFFSKRNRINTWISKSSDKSQEREKFPLIDLQFFPIFTFQRDAGKRILHPRAKIRDCEAKSHLRTLHLFQMRL